MILEVASKVVIRDLFKKCRYLALRDMVSGYSGDGSIVGLDSLGSLFQSQWFYESMIL